MLTTSGWFDWATRVSGPLHRTNGTASNPFREGWVPHSAEGFHHSNRRILMGEIAGRNASWNTEVLLTGELVQYYPLNIACWTSSSNEWNDLYWTTELEGVTGRHGQANAAQRATLWRMAKEYQQWSGVLLSRDNPYLEQTIREHNENQPWTTTACPSGRYDTFYEEWDGYMANILEDMMLAIASGSEEQDSNGQLLTREERIENAKFRIGEIADGIRQSALEQGRSAAQNVKTHEQNHEVAGSRVVLPHLHEAGQVVRD